MNLQEVRPQIFVPMTCLLIILMVWWDCLMTNNWGCGCWDEWRGSSWLNGELTKFNLLPFWKTFQQEHAPSNDNWCICLFLASAAVDTVGLGGVITEKVFGAWSMCIAAWPWICIYFSLQYFICRVKSPLCFKMTWFIVVAINWKFLGRNPFELNMTKSC